MDSEKRPSRRRRNVFVTCAVVLMLIMGFVFALPTLASHFIVPGLLRDALNERIDGDVAVGSLRLSWFGTQQVSELAISSSAHKTDVLLSVEVERSLIALVQDSADLGEIGVQLSGMTSVYDDGSTGLKRMIREPEAQEKPVSSSASKPAAKSTSVDETGTKVAINVAVPSFELIRESGGTVEIVNGAVEVHADTNADVALQVDGALTLRPDISDDFLSVLHPIFEDVAPAKNGIGVRITTFESPMDLSIQSLDVDAEIAVGDVQLLASSAGSRLLSMLVGKMTNDLDARLGPLNLRMSNGILSYKDFQIEIGRLDDGTFKQAFIFDGEIDFGANPPRVIAISAAYPASNLVKIFKELEQVPRSLLETLRPTVVFSGPLYDAKGNRIPLQVKLDPLDLDGGLKPEQVQGIIQGLGELIRGRE